MMFMPFHIRKDVFPLFPAPRTDERASTSLLKAFLDDKTTEKWTSFPANQPNSSIFNISMHQRPRWTTRVQLHTLLSCLFRPHSEDLPFLRAISLPHVWRFKALGGVDEYRNCAIMLATPLWIPFLGSSSLFGFFAFFGFWISHFPLFSCPLIDAFSPIL